MRKTMIQAMQLGLMRSAGFLIVAWLMKNQIFYGG